MTIRLDFVACLRLSVAIAALSVAAPVFAQTAPAKVAPLTRSVATQTPAAAQTRTDTARCSISQVEAAVERHAAPDVVGCNIKDVTAPLLRTGIIPAPSDSNSTQALGTILAQKPAAGEALKRGARLALQVSNGKAPAQETPARTEAPATSAGPEKPAETPPVSSVAPPPESAVAPSSEAAPVQPPVPATPPLLTDGSVEMKVVPVEIHRLTIPGNIVWVLMAVCVLAAILAIGRMTGRGKPSKTLPRVTCKAEFGPGRLVRRGALVLGEKGRE